MPACRADESPLSRVLEALQALAAAVDGMDQDLLVLVTEAHHRGASWAQIALRLGRAKQSVHQRYQRRMYSARTRELLEHDYAGAVRLARELCERGTDAERAVAVAFLRDRLTRQGPV